MRRLCQAVFAGVLGAFSLYGSNLVVAVVVHPSTQIQSIGVSQLRAILLRAVPRWPDNTRLVLASQEGTSQVSRFLFSRILSTTSLDMERTDAHREFAGEEMTLVRILRSDVAACKFVANVPGSLALIDASQLSAPDCLGLRVVKVDGRLPTESGYRLK